MTTKDWFERSINLDKEINELLKEQQNLYEKVTGGGCGVGGEKVQTSKKNVTEDNFIKLAEYSEMIDKRIDELYGIKEEIFEAINTLENTTMRVILISRYIGCKDLKDIAVELYYSEKQVQRLHDKALDQIDVPKCPKMS